MANKKLAVIGWVGLACIGIIFLAGYWAQAHEEYATIKTPITSHSAIMHYTWCDNDHLLVRKMDEEIYQKTINTTHTSVLENKLRYIDVTGKKLERTIDLSLLGKKAWPALCKNGEIVVSVQDDELKELKFFRITVDEPPELLAHVTAASEIDPAQMFSDSARYVLSFYRSGYTKGEGDQERCPAYYLKDGYKRHCWDSWTLYNVGTILWVLPQYIVAKYQWHDQVEYKGDQGQSITVPNPAGKNPDKSPKLKLYDLEQKELATMSGDPGYMVDIDVVISPDEGYAYAACGKRDRKKRTGLDRVCRYRLDGGQHSWEEVFNFDPNGKYERVSIQQMNVGPNGDVYFIELGARNHNYGIWKFDAATQKIKKITSPPISTDEHPRVSPDGKRVAFTGYRDGTYVLLIAQPNK